MLFLEMINFAIINCYSNCFRKRRPATGDVSLQS